MLRLGNLNLNLNPTCFQISGVHNQKNSIQKIYSRRHWLSLLPLTIVHRAQWEGGERMSPSERRQERLELLCLRRHDTYGNLAQEFNVSKRTICRDVAVLMCSYPVETVCGRFGGGVRVMDGYYYHHKSHARRSLNQTQTALLRSLRDQLAGEDRDTINSILVQFAP